MKSIAPDRIIAAQNQIAAYMSQYIPTRAERREYIADCINRHLHHKAPLPKEVLEGLEDRLAIMDGDLTGLKFGKNTVREGN